MEISPTAPDGPPNKIARRLPRVNLNKRRQLNPIIKKQDSIDVPSTTTTTDPVQPEDHVEDLTFLRNQLSQKDHQILQLRREISEYQQQNQKLKQELKIATQTRRSSGIKDLELIVRNSERENEYTYGNGQIDLYVIERNVAMLNKCVNDEPLVITANDHNMKVLKKRLPIDMTFYSNGLLMVDPNATSKEDVFVLYSDRIAEEIVTDLLQGYLPKSLQKAYPDGVKLNIHDRIIEPRLCSPTFSENIQQHVGNYATSTRHLRPTIDPKLDVASSTSNPTQVRTVETDAQQNPLNKKRCCLKVRCPSETLIIYMYYDDTVANLKRIVSKELNTDEDEFELCSGLRSILPIEESMESAKLCPNSVLYFQSNRR